METFSDVLPLPVSSGKRPIRGALRGTGPSPDLRRDGGVQDQGDL